MSSAVGLRQGGFSLLELVVIVSMISIFAAIALPTYQEYSARAVVGAALAEITTFRERIVEELSTKGACPVESNEAWQDSKVLSGYSLRVAGDSSDCVVVAKFKSEGVSAKVVDKVIEVTARPSGGMFSWDCVSDMEASILPPSCSHVEVAPAFP